MKQIVILGENGNLSKSLTKKFPNAIVIPKLRYMDWLVSPDKISKFFSDLETTEEIPDVYNCAGVTDPSVNPSLIDQVNYTLPVFLSEQSNVAKFRLITFGTVMELLPKYSTSNPYLESKLKFYTRYVADDNWQNRNIHIQMHTLYGGSRIHNHMFLGQIFHSISTKKVFNMSGGDQIREYHHIDDDAEAIVQVTNTVGGGLIDISHGKPEKLRDIAISLFDHFNSRALLNIASKAADENDNKNIVFKRTGNLPDTLFRSTIHNLIIWLERLGVVDEDRR
jgi:nucleoside-diphosphate-sugar epimerase